MSVPRRPTRPVTRVPQPGAKPAASRTPTQAGRAAPTGKTTRGIAHSSGRAVAPKKSNMPVLLAAGGGGALLLIIVLVVAMSGGSSPKPSGVKKKASAAAVDVSALERDGETKCEQGYALIQKTQGLMTGRELTPSEKSSLKSELDRGLTLLRDGMNKLEEANAKSGRTYDVVKYNKAMKAARMKLGELGSVK